MKHNPFIIAQAGENSKVKGEKFNNFVKRYYARCL